MGDLMPPRNGPRIEDVLPLTALQQGLVFHAAYDDQAPDVYHVQLAIELEGPLDAPALREAARSLLARHGNLRVSIRQRPQGDNVQVVQSHAPLSWTHVEAATLADADQAAHHDRSQRFDLAAAPLLRFTLIRLGAQHHRLLVTTHHLLLDGWSMPLVMAELLTLYTHRGDAGVLPPATPYAPYYHWLAGRDDQAAREAWRTALADLHQPTRLAPHTDTRTAVIPRHHTARLPLELTESLTRQARRHGLTLSTVVQTTWALLLAHRTGQEDIVFGTTVSGRPPEVPGMETMIGLFINTLPVRVRLQPSETLLDLMARLQREQAELSPHQHLGIADIRRLTTVDGELFDTLTVFENYPLDPDSLTSVTDLRISHLYTHNDAHYPLTLIVTPGDLLTLDFGYRPDLFTPDDIRRLAEGLTRLLRTFTQASPQLLTRDISLLTPQERHQAVEGWNDTARELPPVAVHELFEAQARRSPEAIAVVFEDQEVTYAQLDARADELADSLRAFGIGPEGLVALALPRSVEMLASLLAVLKTGAAYLPIDPDYPADRIAHMLTDAAPALVMATEATQHLAEAHGTPRLLL
ncbi:condensation domain-containing protein [Streptomyces sp. NPDC046887]|uniref:condensation domain-containing protein n=1 Tax=Streptomyces sp. NPDC046887 TaxID=3155472 RepID=UPI0033ED16B5